MNNKHVSMKKTGVLRYFPDELGVVKKPDLLSQKEVYECR